MRKKELVVLLLGGMVFPMLLSQVVRAQEWELVWNDEFDRSGKPDESFWSFEQGFIRNRELQWYQEDNAWCGDGLLIIEGKRQKVKNTGYDEKSEDWRYNRKFASYTASSVKTEGKKEFLYGRFEIRARIPVAGGSWPAIWTLGREMEWPSCGEIDLMEFYRIKDLPHILANAAWGTDTRYVGQWDSEKIPFFTSFTDRDPAWASKFHLWRMDWDETAIKLYLDNELLNEILLTETTNGSLGNYTNPFRQPHYLLLNLAIGGTNGGKPDDTAFPLRYEIDYVRVYQKKNTPIRSSELWPDQNGEHINAHGGGILCHDGKYYWFGEHKSATTNQAFAGITCYSSSDLCHWKNEGVVMPVSDDPASDITKGCTIERPKVIYNKKTGKFVMWFHLELKGQDYSGARAGVAISDRITGPYRYTRSLRPNPGVYPFNMPDVERNKMIDTADFRKWWTPEWYKAVKDGLFLKRDLKTGQMSRDMTLFVDDNGKAYHIYASEENLTLHIAELNDDYLSHSGKYVRLAPAGHNEAPAVFKRKGTYWMITSGCTGWDPNEARMFSASSIWGPWTQYPSPCIGENADITFRGQGTFILPLPGDRFVFMADSWRPQNPVDGRYIWLPVQFNDKGVPVIEWLKEWQP